MTQPSAPEEDDRPSVLLALLYDILAVLVFALVGRLSHKEGLSLGGTVVTVGPFMIGLIVAWFMGLRKLRNPRSLQFAVLIWGGTLFIGMGLRALFGGGTPVSFVIVAAIALAVLLFGWRLIGAALAGRATR